MVIETPNKQCQGKCVPPIPVFLTTQASPVPSDGTADFPELSQTADYGAVFRYCCDGTSERRLAHGTA